MSTHHIDILSFLLYLDFAFRVQKPSTPTIIPQNKGLSQNYWARMFKARAN